MTPKEMAELVVKALDDKKANNIKLLKPEGARAVLADYFVICTANSTPHIKTLADSAEKALSDIGENPLRREGFRAGGWVLLDFGSIVVNIFLEETRQFYGLERLWSDAEDIDITPLVEGAKR